MNNFEQLALHAAIQKSLDKYRIHTPTEIQAQAIPVALQGKDVLASAPTGTGKTIAFATAMLMRILSNDAQRGLIILPTRELAQQLQTEINKLLEFLPLQCVLIIGGMPMEKQVRQLAKNPPIIIGTPGRIIDHINQHTIKTDDIDFLVLDEMDRMFDMGFGIQIQEIMQTLAKKRQTLMFTATMPPKVIALAKKYLNNPQQIFVSNSVKPSDNLEQKIIHTSEPQKLDVLIQELNEREGSAIIFVKTKISADRLASNLTKAKHPAIAMHGDLRPHQRKRAITDFRKGRRRIMVATDIATRGIDISHIQHVINYDLPQNPEDFIHRIGRTARAGSTGHALNIIAPHDKKYWKAINLYIESDGQKVISPKPKKSSRKSTSRTKPRTSKTGKATTNNSKGKKRGISKKTSANKPPRTQQKTSKPKRKK